MNYKNKSTDKKYHSLRPENLYESAKHLKHKGMSAVKSVCDLFSFGFQSSNSDAETVNNKFNKTHLLNEKDDQIIQHDGETSDCMLNESCNKIQPSLLEILNANVKDKPFINEEIKEEAKSMSYLYSNINSLLNKHSFTEVKDPYTPHSSLVRNILEESGELQVLSDSKRKIYLNNDSSNESDYSFETASSGLDSQSISSSRDTDDEDSADQKYEETFEFFETEKCAKVSDECDTEKSKNSTPEQRFLDPLLECLLNSKHDSEIKYFNKEKSCFIRKSYPDQVNQSEVSGIYKPTKIIKLDCDACTASKSETAFSPVLPSLKISSTKNLPKWESSLNHYLSKTDFETVTDSINDIQSVISHENKNTRFSYYNSDPDRLHTSVELPQREISSSPIVSRLQLNKDNDVLLQKEILKETNLENPSKNQHVKPDFTEKQLNSIDCDIFISETSTENSNEKTFRYFSLDNADKHSFCPKSLKYFKDSQNIDSEGAVKIADEKHLLFKFQNYEKVQNQDKNNQNVYFDETETNFLDFQYFGSNKAEKNYFKNSMNDEKTPEINKFQNLEKERKITQALHSSKQKNFERKRKHDQVSTSKKLCINKPCKKIKLDSGFGIISEPETKKMSSNSFLSVESFSDISPANSSSSKSIVDSNVLDEFPAREISDCDIATNSKINIGNESPLQSEILQHIYFENPSKELLLKQNFTENEILGLNLIDTFICESKNEISNEKSFLYILPNENNMQENSFKSLNNIYRIEKIDSDDSIKMTDKIVVYNKPQETKKLQKETNNDNTIYSDNRKSHILKIQDFDSNNTELNKVETMAFDKAFYSNKRKSYVFDIHNFDSNNAEVNEVETIDFDKSISSNKRKSHVLDIHSFDSNNIELKKVETIAFKGTETSLNSYDSSVKKLKQKRKLETIQNKETSIQLDYSAASINLIGESGTVQNTPKNNLKILHPNSNYSTGDSEHKQLLNSLSENQTSDHLNNDLLSFTNKWMKSSIDRQLFQRSVLVNESLQTNFINGTQSSVNESNEKSPQASSRNKYTKNKVKGLKTRYNLRKCRKINYQDHYENSPKKCLRRIPLILKRPIREKSLTKFLSTNKFFQKLTSEKPEYLLRDNKHISRQGCNTKKSRKLHSLIETLKKGVRVQNQSKYHMIPPLSPEGEQETSVRNIEKGTIPSKQGQLSVEQRSTNYSGLNKFFNVFRHTPKCQDINSLSHKGHFTREVPVENLVEGSLQLNAYDKTKPEAISENNHCNRSQRKFKKKALIQMRLTRSKINSDFDAHI